MIALELAHFSNAKRFRAPLLITGAIFAGLGLGLTAAVSAHANAGWRPDLAIAPSLADLGAALLVAAAGFLSAALMGIARRQLLVAELQTAAATAHAAGTPAGAVKAPRWRRLMAPSWSCLALGATVLAAWPATLVALMLGLLALAAAAVSWTGAAATAAAPLARQLVGGSLIVAAFPLLVLERFYAGLAPEMLPEAPQLDRLLRVPLAACLVLGIALVLSSLGFAWAGWIERAFALVVLAIAIEVILRSLAMAFAPFAPIERRRMVADSSVAGLLRFSAPDFHAFNTAVRQQLGIDLSRSWALAFLRRAMLPAALMLALLAWGVTGITALSLNQRAVYERFGQPVAVLGPGLHVHLPWPAGVMRFVELGVIHDIPIALSPAGDATQSSRPSAGVDQLQQLVGAEAAAPASSDRLWDASHPSEQSYLIASEAGGRQSFQVANADLRIVYRIGLSDSAAMSSAYRIADPETLIRAAAGQLLVRYFSRYTLLDVLGQSREAFSNEFRAALQDQLDGLSSGIEAIAVVVEAIHPPPGAASAYHNVQAAEILANSQIAMQRANAVRTIKAAEQAAIEDRNAATAAAAELINQAHGEGILFDADRAANGRDKTAFLLERRFERLVSGLSKSEVIVIDHRLSGQNAPTIDLRSFEAGAAAGLAGSRDVVFPPGRSSGSDVDPDDFVPPSKPPERGSQP